MTRQSAYRCSFLSPFIQNLSNPTHLTFLPFSQPQCAKHLGSYFPEIYQNNKTLYINLVGKTTFLYSEFIYNKIWISYRTLIRQIQLDYDTNMIFKRNSSPAFRSSSLSATYLIKLNYDSVLRILKVYWAWWPTIAIGSVCRSRYFVIQLKAPKFISY